MPGKGDCSIVFRALSSNSMDFSQLAPAEFIAESPTIVETTSTIGVPRSKTIRPAGDLADWGQDSPCGLSSATHRARLADSFQLVC